MPRSDDTFSVHALFSTSRGWLALSLLAVELLTGMQIFLTDTTTPLLAAELHGQSLYGVATAASQVAIFLTMPLGASLMHRFGAARLMLWLTPISVLAGVLSALSPTMWFYIGTRVLAGLAAGVLATVGMGAIVTTMPPSWRQLILAANNLMWLISAVVGPLYAAVASQAWGWRWAMVIYLPFLLIARWVISRQLAKLPEETSTKKKLPVGWAILLSGGIGLLTCMSLGTWWAWGLSVAGGIGIGIASRRILPAGILSARRGARAALALMGILAVMVFAANAVVTILGHDVLGFSAHKIGWLLTSMSFAWSLVGLWCGKFPATGAAFRRRGVIGIGAIAAGLVAMGLALSARHDWCYIGGFFIVGLGMGTVFIDTMNACFTPDARDPLSPTDAAASSVMMQQVFGASLMTITTSLIALNPRLGPVIMYALAAFAVPGLLALWRASDER